MQHLSPISIVKASGEVEKFDEAKVVKTLADSGLSVGMASQTLDYVKKYLKDKVTTKDIYQHTSNYLKENAPKKSYFNYSLKRALFELGPSGHPFEQYTSEILEEYGYETQVSVTLNGKCVSHEIDVIAVKGDTTAFIECKYHNGPGVKSDVQTALYTYARFLDIEQAMKVRFGNDKKFTPWIFTNTKLTYDALDYAKCQNIRATTWGYPKEQGLKELILASNLHPITVLDIQDNKKQELLDRGIVTCKRLKLAIEHQKVTDIFSKSEASKLIEDINYLQDSQHVRATD